jgi:uncharacterized protein (TIGR01777 family)
MRAIITGGTGFVGTALTQLLLSKGYEVRVLSRNNQTKSNITGVSYFRWNPEKMEFPLEALEGVQIIFNLAGAGIADKYWTKKYKKIILNSRLQSGKLIKETLLQHPHTVKSLVCASAIGWYGEDKGGPLFTETDPPADDFLGTICRLWEDSIRGIADVNICYIRSGIVFGTSAGAFPKLIAPLKYGLAAILGDGKQVVSWIHVEDICRIMLYAAENKLAGAYNGVAPLPVTNRYLTIEISHRIRKNSFLPIYVPRFVLRMIMGESSKEVLKSTTVSSEKIVQNGFTFLFPSLKAALDNLLPVKDPA